MWLIIGLGNPGPQYERTRHNCGFMVIDELAHRIGRDLRVSECQALTMRATIGDQEVLLAKPQTFMNLSGIAVAALKEKYAIEENSSILVISDDVALPFGKIRIRRQGSAGGHNGLKSVIAKLGTQVFPRLRLGIAPEHPLTETRDFVLAEFPRKDHEALAEMLARAADAVEAILTKGIAEAMSKYN
ncbi:MAG: aminoacyl-tRNA hydrolase [Acidobacteria bacterium]|nr:aminoacyl-tRNA hydrolase [Acidobacteriota bacterium]